MGHMLEFPVNFYPFTLEFHIKISFGFPPVHFNPTGFRSIYFLRRLSVAQRPRLA